MNRSTTRSRKKSRDTLKQMKMRTQQSKVCGTLEKQHLRGKFIALQVYLKKQEKAQINCLNLHIKELEKEQQTKPTVTRRKKIIKVRAEINKVELKKNNIND